MASNWLGQVVPQAAATRGRVVESVMDTLSLVCRASQRACSVAALGSASWAGVCRSFRTLLCLSNAVSGVMRVMNWDVLVSVESAWAGNSVSSSR